MSQSTSSESQLISANSVIHSPLSTPVIHTPPRDIAQNKEIHLDNQLESGFLVVHMVPITVAFKLVGIMSMSGWSIPLKEMLPFVSRAVSLE